MCGISEYNITIQCIVRYFHLLVHACYRILILRKNIHEMIDIISEVFLNFIFMYMGHTENNLFLYIHGILTVASVLLKIRQF